MLNNSASIQVGMHDGCSASLYTVAQLAQWLEHQTFNLRVMGSNPIVGMLLILQHSLFINYFKPFVFAVSNNQYCTC